MQILSHEDHKSKETYGQTCGLSNLEMKHVGKLAIIGTLLKAVKTSCVRTMQGRTYIIKRRLFHWLLLHTYYKIARVTELQNLTEFEPNNLSTRKCVPTSSHWFFFHMLSFSIWKQIKNVNKRLGKNHLNLSELSIWEEFVHFRHPTQSLDECTNINNTSMENRTLI